MAEFRQTTGITITPISQYRVVKATMPHDMEITVTTPMDINAQSGWLANDDHFLPCD